MLAIKNRLFYSDIFVLFPTFVAHADGYVNNGFNWKLCWTGGVCWQVYLIHVSVWQTVIEKHKMNVPETMNEVLDMSDDEGEESFCSFIWQLIDV